MRVLPGLTYRTVPRELLAGVTLVAIAVPLNIGYAQIAGLPPTAGLYALVVPAVVFALLASSRQLVASPDAAAAALVASSIGGLVAAGSPDYASYALAQALLGGAFFAVCAVFRLGFLASFLSEPILVGFVGGLAFDILTSQVAKMLGVHLDSGGEWLVRIGQILSGLRTTNGWSVVLAAATVLVLVVGRRIAPRVPWALVALVAATVALVAGHLDHRGVATLGRVEAGLPRLTWPAISGHAWLQLVPSALALTLVTMAEGLLVARRYAEQREYADDPDRDLLALGAANVAAGFTGGFTVGSSASRTAAMDAAGSRTQLPSVVGAVAALLLVLFGTSVLADLPSPAIGAVVAVAVAPLVGVTDLRRLWGARRFEFAVGAVCFLASLLLGPILGIAIAFVLSLVNVARRAARPAVDVLGPGDGPAYPLRARRDSTSLTAPGVVVLRFAAPLFFANAQVLADSVDRVLARCEPDGLRHLVLDCEAITDVDVTAASVVARTAARVRARGISFDYSRVRAGLRADLEHFDLVGPAVLFDSNRTAVAALTEPARRRDGP